LGYIAARALGRRLIEADDEFERQTGRSRAQFLKEHQNNGEEYRLQERHVMESMLAKNQTDAVIVCGVGSIESHGQTLLQKYALHHPVIHIVRETEHVRAWLRIPEESNLMQRLEDSDRKHRICSNFEFYNLFDGGSQSSHDEGWISRGEGPGQRSPRYVGALQRTQQDFIRFVNLAMGFNNPPLQQLLSKISAPASSPEDRVYTYALLVEFAHIANEDIDIKELECGADAIELVVKGSDISGESVTVDSKWVTKLSEQFAVLRRKIAAPIILHVDRRSFEPSLGGRMSMEETYLELLHIGTRLGAEFVTIDIDFDEISVRHFLRSKGSTRIIAHSFDPRPSHHDTTRNARYTRAVQLPCDVVRITQFATSDDDNTSIRRLHKYVSSEPLRVRRPLISYNIGRLGRASMCSNGILTSVTHPVLRARKQLDEAALLTMQEASRMTYDLGMLDPMHFYIIGASVLYSLSPPMHNAAYRACGLPHTYKIRQSSTLKELDGLMKDPTFGGASISLPFKIEITKTLSSLSSEARAIGAVNTIIPIRESASGAQPSNSPRIQRSRADRIIGWHGDNTDWIGVTTCVRRNLSPANMIRPWTSSLVIGAGGMARAAVYALIRLEVPNIFIYNRTVANAEKLAVHFNDFAANFQNTPNVSNRRQVNHRITVLKSMDEAWPAEYEQPTIIISSVPAHSIGGNPPANITLPLPWLQSVNGGVIVEVRSFFPIRSI
jgi:3-dehydroquinate dehydratase type I